MELLPLLLPPPVPSLLPPLWNRFGGGPPLGAVSFQYGELRALFIGSEPVEGTIERSDVVPVDDVANWDIGLLLMPSSVNSPSKKLLSSLPSNAPKEVGF